MGLYLPQEVRRRLGFEGELPGAGRVPLPDIRAARLLAHRVAERLPGGGVRASHLHALGLLDEVLRFVVDLYLRERPGLFGEALGAI